MGRNEEVVRAVLEAVNRRDADGDQAYLGDDLVYRRFGLDGVLRP